MAALLELLNGRGGRRTRWPQPAWNRRPLRGGRYPSVGGEGAGAVRMRLVPLPGFMDGVELRVMHQRDSLPLATSPGGLVLNDSPEALTLTAELPDTAAARDVVTLARAGVSLGLSIEAEVSSKTGRRM